MGAAKRFTQNPGSNAICYYRYSSGAQRDVSIDQQREAAQEYAKAHGYHIIKEYEDHAISGTSDERPQFQQMQELESQKSILNDALLAERNRKKFALKRSDILRFLDSFAGDLDNPETRRRLLDSLIDKIYVYPDRLVITFHYSDDRRELAFEEMEQLLANSRTIESMLGEYREAPTEATAKMRESLLGESDKSEKRESPDFFP